MDKYRKKLSPADEKFVRWSEVYQLFEEKAEEMKHSKSRFLLEEFNNYLKLMDMVPFRGFERKKLKNNFGGYVKGTKFLQATPKGKLGSFARALKEKIEEKSENHEDFPLRRFSLISNKINTSLHLLKKKDLDSAKSFTDVNHFTIGFWRDWLNVHLNIRKRITGNVNKRGKSVPKEEFVEVIKDTFPGVSALSNKDNPMIYNRLERNIQQKFQKARETEAFDFYTFIYYPDLSSNLLEKKIEGLAKANREAKSKEIGNLRCLALGEKRIPFDSEFIVDEKLPKYCLKYFQEIYPLFKYFEK